MRNARSAAAAAASIAVLAAALSALADPDAGAPPPAASEEERPLESVPIGAEHTPLPKFVDWATAPRVRPTRRSAAGAGCRVYLLHEWMKVRCTSETFALSLVGGDFQGVAFWIDPVTKEGEVLMPLRRGGTHVVQLWKSGKEAAGSFVPQPSLLVQQYWLEGAAAPVITIF
jgi:hypothetical protein